MQVPVFQSVPVSSWLSPSRVGSVLTRAFKQCVQWAAKQVGMVGCPVWRDAKPSEPPFYFPPFFNG